MEVRKGKGLIMINKMNCELMIPPQTGSRNVTGPKTLHTIWGTYMKLVTKYQISAIKNATKNILGRTEGQTEGRTEGRTEVKQYTPSGGAGVYK
jgi:hypothetical protein